MRHPIFLPMVALTVLVAVVWVRMYVSRIRETRKRRIDPEAYKTSAQTTGLLADVAAADNFRNLFEVPVLFYAVCCALAIAEAETPVQVFLAWLFVGLRAVHSFIHVTYNRVMHRFVSYVLGTVVVFTMWVLFAISLFERG